MKDEAPGANPYPGLRPFQADETHLFFGRDEQRIELLHRLRRSRFLAIVGTSGSGKSSLVRAGLLPGLHGGFMAGQSEDWRIVDLRPGTDAIGNLARALDAPGALRDATAPTDEPSFTETTLRRSGLGLVEAVREARLPKTENVLVLVDQFEELFRAIEAADRPQSSDDASAFVKLLLEAARQDELPLYIVLTMRSDFLGECSRFRDLPEAINGGQYLIPRLTPDQRSQAITGPAAVFGVTLSSTLVNRLLNDVGENPDQLPILQHALMRTWDHWQLRPAARAASDEIQLADYESIGGMSHALSLHADAVFDGLAEGCTPETAARRKSIVERLFKSLAAIGAGGTAIRRLARVQEIVEVSAASLPEVAFVIDAFRAPGQSFLMPPAGEALTPDRYVDISHESLIRNWARMKAWVEEEAESARVYERLSSTALLHARGDAALLHQPDLGVALKWQATQKPNPGWAQRYNAVYDKSMAFLEASRVRAQAAEDEKARRRRLWAAGIAVVFFAMLTGILTWGREELTRVEASAKQAREAQAELQKLKAISEIRRAREVGIPAAGIASLCAGPSKAAKSGDGATGGKRNALLDKLCTPGSTLEPNEQRLIGLYEQVLDGRWRDATQGFAQLGDNDDADNVKQLLGQLATMRSPSDRGERSLLFQLRNQRNTIAEFKASEAQRNSIAGLMQPVHRRIAKVLIDPSTEPSREEELLLTAYASVEGPKFAHDGASRKSGRDALDELRGRPFGNVYADLARVALSPESKVIEAFDIAMSLLRENLWAIGIFMVWPAWRLRRGIQRRQGQAIVSRPNPLRVAVAAWVDIGIAVGVGVLVGAFADALAGIGISVAKLQEDYGGIGAIVGIAAGAAYYLGRDALRLRYRRSIGKAMFDLRPLALDPAGPGVICVRKSMKRNGVFPIGVVAVTLAGLMLGWPRILVSLLLFLLLLLTDFIRSCVARWGTFGDRWSKTRVVDSESAESLAARP